MNNNDFEKQAIDLINAKRFNDLVFSIDNPESTQNRAMRRLRAQKRKSEKKLFNMLGDDFPVEHVASLTAEQDMEFSKAYGNNYYKDPDFFTKRFPQLSANPDTETD